MRITSNTLRLLQQHKLLRGSFAERLRKRSPIYYDTSLLNRPLHFNEMATFLSNYTLEEIGKDLDWARTYSITHHKRFPLAEVEDRMRWDKKQWRWYIQGLAHSIDTNTKDSTWAVGEEYQILLEQEQGK